MSFITHIVSRKFMRVSCLHSIKGVNTKPSILFTPSFKLGLLSSPRGAPRISTLQLLAPFCSAAQQALRNLHTKMNSCKSGSVWLFVTLWHVYEQQRGCNYSLSPQFDSNLNFWFMILFPFDKCDLNILQSNDKKHQKNVLILLVWSK